MKRGGETKEGADLLGSSSVVVSRGEGTEAVQGRGPHEGRVLRRGRGRQLRRGKSSPEDPQL